MLIPAAAIVALLLPATAVAKTYNLKGSVKRDANSSVKVKVKAEAQGAGQFNILIKRLKIRGIDSSCDGEVSGVVKNVFASGPVGTSGAYLFDAETLEAGTAAGSTAFGVAGHVSRGGKQVDGDLDLFMSNGDGTFAQCGTVEFSAKK
jgi:hypothetical protein